jgi:hypothetical protein
LPARLNQSMTPEARVSTQSCRRQA